MEVITDSLWCSQIKRDPCKELGDGYPLESISLMDFEDRGMVGCFGILLLVILTLAICNKE